MPRMISESPDGSREPLPGAEETPIKPAPGLGSRKLPGAGKLLVMVRYSPAPVTAPLEHILICSRHCAFETAQCLATPTLDRPRRQRYEWRDGKTEPAQAIDRGDQALVRWPEVRDRDGSEQGAVPRIRGPAVRRLREDGDAARLGSHRQAELSSGRLSQARPASAGAAASSRPQPATSMICSPAGRTTTSGREPRHR